METYAILSIMKKENTKNSDSISSRFQKEISDGLEFIRHHKGTKATIFGSHKVIDGDFFYNDAILLGRELSKKSYVIICGGGPGIMQAIAKGCKDNSGVCLGMRAKLLTNEHTGDSYYSSIIEFNFLEARKHIMATESSLLIFYPGGLGTLDEFFEYLVQLQLGILKNKRIFCIGKEYWSGLMNWLNDRVSASNYLISNPGDISLVNIVSDYSEIISIINRENITN